MSDKLPLECGDLSPLWSAGTCSRIHHNSASARQVAPGQKRRQVGALQNYFFFTAFISDSNMTGAGPEMPPSLRMRQKCTAIKIEATSGIPMQCQI